MRGHRASGIEKQLQGRWRWIQSTEGYAGDTIFPASVGNLKFEFDFLPGGKYREYRDVSLVLSSGYSSDQDTAFKADPSVQVLRLDSSVFFPGIGDTNEQAVKELRGDTLVLSGIESESRYHMFVRQKGGMMEDTCLLPLFV